MKTNELGPTLLQVFEMHLPDTLPFLLELVPRGDQGILLACALRAGMLVLLNYPRSQSAQHSMWSRHVLPD